MARLLFIALKDFVVASARERERERERGKGNPRGNHRRARA